MNDLIIGFRRGLIVGGFLAASLWAATARCEPFTAPEQLPSLVELSTACAPEVQHRRASLSHGGQPGLWFAQPIAQCMASRLALVPELRKLVTLYEERARASDAHVVLLVRQLAVSREIETQLEEALTRAIAQAREAEERAGRWHRRPALWWSVGLVSAVALQVVALRTVGALGD